MAQDLKKAGFDAKASGVDANKWYADLAAGTFDTAIHWGSTSPSPYAQYQGWLDSTLAKGEAAKNRTGNFGGYDNPKADAALADYAKAADENQAKAAITTLSQIMADDAPVIPLMYAAGWYEYNTTKYDGWVDESNQYVDPSPNPANVMYVVLHLKPAGS